MSDEKSLTYWLGDELMRARHALAVKDFRLEEVEWDLWLGWMAWVALLKDAERLGIFFQHLRTQDELEQARFVGVRIHEDAGQPNWEALLVCGHAPVRWFNLQDRTVVALVDHPQAMAREIEALAQLKLPMLMLTRTRSVRFVKMRPMKWQEPPNPDDPVPITAGTYDLDHFERLGLLSVTQDRDGWLVDLTHAGRVAIAQWKAFPE